MAWLANWHVLRVQQGWSEDARQDTYFALECTKRALDIDPDCSLALAINGFVHVNLLKQFDVGESPTNARWPPIPATPIAWLLKGTLHAFKSEGRQAVDNTERALRLSPLDPHRYFYDSLAATACVANRQYDRALDLAQRSLRANRKHTSTWRVMTIAQWQLGQFEAARKISSGSDEVAADADGQRLAEGFSCRRLPCRARGCGSVASGRDTRVRGSTTMI